VRLTLFFCEAGYTEILFLIWAKWIFLWVHLDPQKNMCFSVRLFLFPCVIFWWYTVRKIFFRGYSNFSVGFCTHRNIRVSSSARRFVNNPDEQLASSSRYMVDLYLNSKRQVLLAVMSSLKINSQKHEGAVRRACSCKKQWLTRHWLLRVSAGPDHRINPYLTLTVWSMHSV